jgi:hypothetical protein
MIQALHNAPALARFLDRTTTGRGDVVLVADSNGIHSTDAGHRIGFARAFWNLFDPYATGVLSPNPAGGWTADDWTVAPGTSDPLTSAAQAAWLEAYRLGVRQEDAWAPNWFSVNGTWGALGGDYTINYAPSLGALLGDGTTNFDGTLGSPLNKANVVRAHFTYATFASGSGGLFYPSLRQVGSLTTLTATAPSVSTTTGVNGIADTYVDAPATIPGGATLRRTVGVAAQPHFHGVNMLVGPVTILGLRFENPAQVRGISYAAMLVQGGQPTRVAALTIQGATTTALGEYFRQATMLQNVADDQVMLLVHVVQGQNDTGDTNQSVGPNPTASNTADGVADNHQAIIDAALAAWVAQGFTANNLFFLFGPYHPQARSRKVWGGQVDAALRKLADDNDNVAVAKGFRPYLAAGYTRYAVAMAQEGASGRWAASLPAEMRTAGKYKAVVMSRAGGSAAESDTRIDTVLIDYDGLRDRNTVEADVTLVDGGPATLDAERIVQIVNRQITVRDN